MLANSFHDSPRRLSIAFCLLSFLPSSHLVANPAGMTSRRATFGDPWGIFWLIWWTRLCWRRRAVLPLYTPGGADGHVSIVGSLRAKMALVSDLAGTEALILSPTL